MPLRHARQHQGNHLVVTSLLSFFQSDAHLALYPFRAQGVEADDYQKMAGAANGAFDPSLQVVSAS